MRNILTIVMVVWMFFVAGLVMLNLATGWAIIIATLLVVVIGGIGYWIYKKMDMY
jgi:hypothetical protein